MVSLSRYQILLAVAFMLSVLPCQARLGETLDQCIARYGQPVYNGPDPQGVGEGTTRFEKNGYLICVFFLKGIVAFEIFYKHGDDDYSNDEKDAILQADSAGGKWTKIESERLLSNPSVKEAWIREDGAVATIATGTTDFGHTLTISTKEYRAAMDAKTASDAKNNLKDF